MTEGTGVVKPQDLQLHQAGDNNERGEFMCWKNMKGKRKDVLEKYFDSKGQKLPQINDRHQIRDPDNTEITK